MTPPTITQAITSITRILPDCWKQVDWVRSQRGKALPSWPEWCFMPTAYSSAILCGWSPTRSAKLPTLPTNLIRKQWGLMQVFPALAAWRVTQGVYSFHPALQPVIESTELKGNLPAEIFYSMPEWCVYIPTPNHHFFHHQDTYMQGFLAYLDWDLKSEKPTLRLVADNKSLLAPLGTMYLNEDTIEANIAAAACSSTLDSAESLKKYLDPNIKVSDLATPDEAAKMLSPLVNLLLYVCARNAEIRDTRGKKNRPAKPLPVKTKAGPRIFPPPQPTIWDIGYRVGPALERVNQSAIKSNIGSKHAPHAPTFDEHTGTAIGLAQNKTKQSN